MTTTAVFAAAPAVVAAVVAGVVAGWPAAVIALVVVAAGLAAWAWLAGDRIVARALRGRPAERHRDARLVNLVDGLSIAAGVRTPRLVVVDSPALNALAAGTSARRAVVAVTSGLLAECDRIELEAVLAAEMWLVRHEETLPRTVLAATFGLGRDLALRRDEDTRTDRGAVALTRYPPALAAALDKIYLKGANVAPTPARLAHLWLVDPRAQSPASRGRVPVPERVEALRDL
jgi:Zn-dependent protease with chaperone function